MENIELLKSCIDGLNDGACITRINNSLSWPNILIPVCMLFMTLAAIGAIIELSSKRSGQNTLIKFICSLALCSFLVFIPISIYMIDVLQINTDVVPTLKELSWYHYLRNLPNRA